MSFLPDDCRRKNSAREIGPILPRYMQTMISHLPNTVSCGVSPRDSPTVAVALNTSYTASCSGA